MKGIEKITARITQEAQAEIDRTLADAREQAAQITARYQAQADARRQASPPGTRRPRRSVRSGW